MFDYKNLDDLVNPNLSITAAKNYKSKATKMFYLYGFILTVVCSLSGAHAIGSLIVEELDKFTTTTAAPIAFLIFFLIDRIFYWSKKYIRYHYTRLPEAQFFLRKQWNVSK